METRAIADRSFTDQEMELILRPDYVVEGKIRDVSLLTDQAIEMILRRALRWMSAANSLRNGTTTVKEANKFKRHALIEIEKLKAIDPKSFLSSQ